MPTGLRLCKTQRLPYRRLPGKRLLVVDKVIRYQLVDECDVSAHKNFLVKALHDSTAVRHFRLHCFLAGAIA